MSYPAAALQKALFDALTGNAALAAAMGGAVRAYDIVPPSAAFPYLTIADAQILDDGDTCEADRFEANADVQVWSRAVGSVEAKTISGAVRAAIAAGLTATGWLVTVIDCRSVQHFMDPDGLTARARLSFRFVIEPA